ncbi:DUF1801 domain-containing protein [Bacillus daqingensis]|uniref:DUF1801 domain-containing protein n=1 Tax=Bacillus daqingensis TaxID=872396 RepID=A0ABV9NPJ3_9BACI
MKLEAESPEEYVNKLPDDWRRDQLLAVREKMLAHKAVKEEIEHGMLMYRIGMTRLFHVGVQKAYVSVYAGCIEKVDPEKKLLEDFSVGKSCIRISRAIDLEDTGLPQFIAAAVAKARRGEDVGC